MFWKIFKTTLHWTCILVLQIILIEYQIEIKPGPFLLYTHLYFWPPDLAGVSELPVTQSVIQHWPSLSPGGGAAHKELTLRGGQQCGQPCELWQCTLAQGATKSPAWAGGGEGRDRGVENQAPAAFDLVKFVHWGFNETPFLFPIII